MIIEVSELPNLRNKYSDHTIMLGNGVFDLLHSGHLAALEKMKDIAGNFIPGKPGLLIIEIPEDALIAKNKAPTQNVPRPVRNQDDRARLIDGIGVVDFVFIGTQDDCPDGDRWPDMTYIRSLKPDIYKASNAADWEKYYPEMETLGTTSVQVNIPSDQSTTSIIEKICHATNNKSPGKR